MDEANLCHRPRERAGAKTARHSDRAPGGAAVDPWSGRAAPVPLALVRAPSLADEGLRTPAAAALDASEPNVQVGGAPPRGSLLTGLDWAAGSRGIENMHVVDRSASRLPDAMSLNLNSHNHNQHAGRPCFSLAIQIKRSTSTLRYDISRSRKLWITRRACCSCTRRLPTATSVNDDRTVVRPLQTERSASDADDNRTALYAPPTARFTELGMSVSLPILIQSRHSDGARLTSGRSR
jgi:hypothetical protein